MAGERTSRVTRPPSDEADQTASAWAGSRHERTVDNSRSAAAAPSWRAFRPARCEPSNSLIDLIFFTDPSGRATLSSEADNARVVSCRQFVA